MITEVKSRVVACVSFLMLSLSWFNVAAQAYPHTDVLYERTWLATDRDVYIPGDKILVSLATIDGYYQLPISFSAVAYVELYSTNLSPLVQEKALLGDGKGAVVITIPKNVETDFYYLRAYTNYQKNFGENSFFCKKLRVVNPFKIISVDKTADSSSTAGVAFSYLFRNDSLIISSADSVGLASVTIKSAFDNDYMGKNLTMINDSTLAVPLRGMKNVLSAHSTDGKTLGFLSDSARGIAIAASAAGSSIQYSAAVPPARGALYAVSAFQADHGRFSDTYCSPGEPVSMPSLFVYQPELATDLLFGYVSVKAGATLPKHILVSVARSVSSMHVATVKADSSFVLDMGVFHNNSNLIFTPTDTSSSISVNFLDEFFPRFSPVSPRAYVPEEYLGTYIQSLMVNVQIADAFSRQSTPVADDMSTFYGRWDEKLVFDKFINLPSIEEYIHELLPSVYVVKKRKRKSIRISDYNGRGFIGKNPLLVVDGTPFFNHAAVLYVPPKEVEVAYVLNRRLSYHSALFDGVLDIRTKSFYSEELDRASNTIELEYVSPKKYAHHEVLFSNAPLWQPVSSTPPSGQFSRIQPGKLVVRLQGLCGGTPFDVYSETVK